MILENVNNNVGELVGLESLESRIIVHQKNEAVFEEDIAFLKYDVNVNESEEDNNQANDRYKTGKGYHAVPPLYTGNFMPPRPDLSFAGLDDSVFKSAISDPITSVHETKTNTSNTSKESIEKPKTVRLSAPITKD
nr:hypothetical protein [Tanacetum cinerariifolium]